MAARSKKLREAKMDERREGEGRRARSRLVRGGDRLSDEQVATTESKEAVAVRAALERWEHEGGYCQVEGLQADSTPRYG